ncbi:MAG TPA: hypothetical protein VEZ48_10750 [Sphingomonadaceae bacterium]|nr:hypothetical protein [Sphingomonadaceae bacterium]
MTILTATSATSAQAQPRAAGTPAASPAERSFERLKSLVGTWRGAWSDGRPVGLTYRLSAGGTVVVETWALSPTRESLTLYHMDKGALLATHYCPQGNQPRLRLTDAASDRMSFAFRDVTDLDPATESHQHAFSLRFDGPNRIARHETYRTGKTDETDLVVFERSAAAP